MGRFIVFDDETRGKLPKDLLSSIEFDSDFQAQNTAEYLAHAIDSEHVSVVMIPSTTAGHVRLIHIRQVPKPETVPDEVEPIYEATGFLGLTDSLCEPERPRRRWWQRLRS